MNDRGAELASAPESLLDTPFKLHGRNAQSGVDCVGVLLIALRTLGIRIVEPPSYSLRNICVRRQVAAARYNELEEVSGPISLGDVLLLKISAVQFHLGIVSRGNTIVHAHAGLGRVVVSSLTDAYVIENHWRIRAN